MKPKSIITLIVAIFTVLAGLTIWQWVGGNVAIQIGGEGNKIEQHLAPQVSTKSSK